MLTSDGGNLSRDANGWGAQAVPSLFVIRGNDQGTRFELESSTLQLGRDAASNIQCQITVGINEAYSGSVRSGRQLSNYLVHQGALPYPGPANDSGVSSLQIRAR